MKGAFQKPDSTRCKLLFNTVKAANLCVLLSYFQFPIYSKCLSTRINILLNQAAAKLPAACRGEEVLYEEEQGQFCVTEWGKNRAGNEVTGQQRLFSYYSVSKAAEEEEQQQQQQQLESELGLHTMTHIHTHTENTLTHTDTKTGTLSTYTVYIDTVRHRPPVLQ